MTSTRPVWPWYAAAAGLVLLDQITKLIVRLYLPLHDSVLLIGPDLLRLTHVENPGIAFGMRILGVNALLIFGWIAAAAMTWYLFGLVKTNDPLRWPIVFFLAGAVGNSIDRTLFGHVTDFVDADFPDFIMERWAVFNVADSCVTIGITILILLAIFVRRPRSAPSLSNPNESTLPTGTDSLSSDDRTRSAAVTD